MPVRAPHLHHALRCFCLAAFAELAPEVESAGEVGYVVDEHESGLLEYRPLVRDHVHARAYWLAKLGDAQIATGELAREPAARIFASAHGGDVSTERGLFRSLLLPLLVRTAEACGGFDWDENAFEHVYGELERSLFGTNRSYTALAPLLGLSIGSPVELGVGLRVRVASPGVLTGRWPEASGLLPLRFGVTPERACVLELERELPGDAADPPDAPAELSDAVTALRLATAAPVAAGPVVFEQLDWHPFGIRPLLGIAATEPEGEPSRLDPFRGGLARELLEHLAAVEGDAELAEALERWELSLFESEPACSERLRESLAALLGGPDGMWAGAMRAAVLLGGSASIAERMRDLGRGERGDEVTRDAVRRALVEVLGHGDRARLVDALDESLLGLRPRPSGYYAARAAV